MWLSIGVVFSNFFGFIYWLVMSKFVEVDVVGRAAAILSVEALITAFINLGIPIGVQRFMGAMYSRRDYEKLSQYYYSPMILLFILSLSADIILIVLSLMYNGLFSLDLLSIIFLCILIICGFNGWSIIGQSFFNATLKTEYTALTQISSSLIRLAVSLLLIYLGYSFIGLMMGYVVAGLTTSILMLTLPMYILTKTRTSFSFSINSIRDSLRAGVSSWIPDILTLLSQCAGVLGVYSIGGLAETGLYFIAFTITSAVMSFPQSILTLSFPTISGMHDGRKRAMYRAVKISASLIAPIAFFLILYSSILPKFLGEAYTGASEPIRLLTLGYLISPINAGYTYYAYAIGNYSHVLAIGLAGTIPRLLLYPLLINLYGDIGAAVTFSLGNITTLLMVIILARKMNYNLQFKEYLKIIMIPSALSVLLKFFEAYWVIGLMILSVSYFIYAKLRIITKEDLREIGESIASRQFLEKLYPYLRPILSLIY
ncbi:MAG: oligosaccharide flippase family protein [Ignisphaera sp.]